MHPVSISSRDAANEPCQKMCGRPSAVAALLDKARRMHEQACALEKLADSASCIHGAAEEVLWDLVNRSR